MKKRLLLSRRNQIEYRTITEAIDAATCVAEGAGREMLTKFGVRYLDLAPARALIG